MKRELVSIVASTQYGDFKGTVSFDEADSSELLPLLEQKVKLPAGYSAVGFSVGAEARNPGPGHFWGLTVYAVDTQTVAAGPVAEYAREHDHIPVFEFHASMEPAEVADLLLNGFKRFCMVAATRGWDDRPMVKLDNN